MKKHLFILLGVLLSLSSCTDKDDIDISFDSTITVTAAHIFDSYQAENATDFANLDGWKVQVYTLVYDEAGKVVKKAGGNSTNLKAGFKLNMNIAPGKYKIVSIASFENDDIKYWNITNADDINTLTINEIEDNPFGSPYETLGIDVREFIVDGKSFTEEISIKPVTGLVQMEFHMRKIVEKYDGTYGFRQEYHRWINTFYFSTINQKTNCNQVRFPNGQIEYGYQTQSSNYQMAGLLTSDAISLGSGIIYSYRALLPQSGKEFSWSYMADLYGQTIVEESTGTGQDSGFLEIESGKQYDLYMFYDVLYLYAANHDASISTEARLKEAMKYVPEWCAPEKE